MSRLRADKVVNKAATGAPELTYGATVPAGGTISGAGGINLTGIVTATSFVGNVTGNVTGGITGNVTGTATTATNLSNAANITTGTIDSARLSGTYSITASNAEGLTGSPNITVTNVSAQDVQVGGALTVTGNLTVNGTTTTIDTVLTEVDKLEVGANNSTVGAAITQSGVGDILRLYDSSTQVFTVADGGNVGINSTVPKGALDVLGRAHFNGGLVEKINIKAQLTGNNSCAITDGNVILTTTNEPGNTYPNITGVHSNLAVGEGFSVTIALKVNGSGTINNFQIDGVGPTIEWSGGSAPSAGASGYDVFTFSAIKTGTGTGDYAVFGAATNYT